MTVIVDASGKKQQLNSQAALPAKTVAEQLTEPSIKEISSAAQPPEGEAERLARLREERKRVSLSVPQQKMKVAEIPGFHTHWVNDSEGKIQQALRAGYDFVDNSEVSLADFSFAGDSTKTGNQDLGSRVSMVVGTDSAGGPMRAYLMKLPQEKWEIDQGLLQEQNDRIADSLRRGRVGTAQVSPEDLKQTYVKTVEVSRQDVRIKRANPTDGKTSI